MTWLVLLLVGVSVVLVGRGLLVPRPRPTRPPSLARVWYDHQTRGGAAVVGLTPSPRFVPPVMDLDGPPACPAHDPVPVIPGETLGETRVTGWLCTRCLTEVHGPPPKGPASVSRPVRSCPHESITTIRTYGGDVIRASCSDCGLTVEAC